MTTRKQLDPASSKHHTLSADIEDWIRQFLKHLELNVVEACANLPAEAGEFEARVQMARAVITTYMDSGMDHEAVLALLSQAAVKSRISKEAGRTKVVWTESLNQRRFELIDKDIQRELTPAERIELNGLTSLMRERLESEQNLPMKGLQELHRRLLQTDSTDKTE